jgi:hypothetical protein
MWNLFIHFLLFYFHKRIRGFSGVRRARKSDSHFSPFWNERSAMTTPVRVYFSNYHVLRRTLFPPFGMLFGGFLVMSMRGGGMSAAFSGMSASGLFRHT